MVRVTLFKNGLVYGDFWLVKVALELTGVSSFDAN